MIISQLSSTEKAKRSLSPSIEEELGSTLTSQSH